MSQTGVYLSVFVVIALFHAVWIGSIIGLVGIAFRPRRDIFAVDKARHHNSAYSANLVLLVLLALTIPIAGILSWSTVASRDLRPSRLADVEPSNDGHVSQRSEQTLVQSLQNLDNLNEDAFAESSANSGIPGRDYRPSTQNTGGKLNNSKAESPDSSFRGFSQAFLGRSLGSQLVFIAPWVAAAYLIGAALMLARVVIMLIGSQRIMKRAQQIQDLRILNMLSELSRRLGIAVVPVLATTNRILTPVVVGIWRPMILVPTSLITGLSVHELEMILIHELTHIRRHDQLVVMLQRIVEAILFFHPTTWYLSSRLNRERELQCDDAVLALGSSPLEYATLLCRVAEIAQTIKQTKQYTGLVDPIAIAATGTSDDQLIYRVRRMLGEASCSFTTPAVTIPRIGGASFLAISVMLTAFVAWYSMPESLDSQNKNSALATLPVALSDESNQEDDSALNYVPDVLIAGVVVDKNDNPVAGAVVWVQPRKQQFEAVSSASGAFEFKVPKSVVPGLLVQARTKGQTIRGSGRVPWENSDEISKALKIVVEPATRVVINVVDGTNQPLAGVHVGAIANHNVIGVGRTEQNGTAELLVPNNIDTEYVYAFSSDFGVDYRAFVLPRADHLKKDAQKPTVPDEPIQLRLDGVQSFSVVVMDDSSEPLAGVEVYPFLLSKEGEADSLNLSTLVSQIGLVSETTNASGVATINWVPKWEKGIVSFNASRAEYSYGSVNFDPKDGDHDLAIHLSRKIPVEGQVTHLDGSPAKDVEIRFHGSGLKAGESLGTHSAAVVFTNESGQFEFFAEPHQAYIGQLQHDPNVFADSTLFSIEDQPLDEPLKFSIRPPTRLFGRVTFGDDKQPIVGDSLNLTLSETRDIPIQSGSGMYRAQPGMMDFVKTNSNGEFEFKAGFGKYRIQGGSDNQVVEFEIDDAAEEEINFHSAHPPKTKLSGAVVTRDDSKSVPSAIIHGLYIDPRADGSLPTVSGKGLTTTDDGKFEIERQWFPLLLCARSADGKLAGFAEVAADQNVVTIPIGPLKTVTGRLIDANTGLPMPGKDVRCVRRFDHEGGGTLTTFDSSAVTDAEGKFRFDDLVSAAKYDFTLTLEKKNGMAMSFNWISNFTIDPNSEQLELGDVKYKATERSRSPTIKERVATSFGATGSPVERFDTAKSRAKLNKQHILVLFGRPDSEINEQLWKLRYEVDETRSLFFGFVVLAIDASEANIDQANALADQFHFNLELSDNDFQILVVDQDANFVTNISSSDLLDSKTGEVSESKVARFLTENTPKPSDGQQLLDEALALAKSENKRVLVQETATWCGPCFLLSQYLERTRELWTKDYVWVKMDHRWTGALEIMKALRGDASGGIPWFVILDAEGKPLATSNRPDGNNMGFPTVAADFSHFQEMLKQTAIRLNEAEIDELIRELSSEPPSTSLAPKPAMKPKPPVQSQDKSEITTISGQVVDAQDRPVAGAQLLWSISHGSTENSNVNGVSDANGRFSMSAENVAAVRRSQLSDTVWVLKNGYLLSTVPAQSTTLVDGKSLELQICLVPDSDTSFVVLAPDQQPLAGVEVEPWHFRTRQGYDEIPADFRKLLTAKTDPEGRVRMPNLPLRGFHTVRVNTEKFGTQGFRLDGNPNAAAERTLELRETGRIEGRVIADNPDWIRGLRLLFFAEPGWTDLDRKADLKNLGWNSTGHATAVIDDEGRFTIPFIATGRLQIIGGNHPDIPVLPRLPEGILVTAGEPAYLEITFQKPIAVHGRISAQDTNVPIPGAEISVRFGSGMQGKTVVSDANGRYDAGVLPGPVRTHVIVIPKEFKNYVETKNPGGEAVDVVSNETSVELPEIRLSPTIALEGKVIDQDGRPVANVRLNGVHKNRRFGFATTNELGEFSARQPQDIEFEHFQIWLNDDSGPIKPTIVSVNPLVLRINDPSMPAKSSPAKSSRDASGDKVKKLESINQFFSKFRQKRIGYEAARIGETIPFAKCILNIGDGGTGIISSAELTRPGDTTHREVLLHPDDAYLTAWIPGEYLGKDEPVIAGGFGWKKTDAYKTSGALFFGAFSDGHDIYDLNRIDQYPDTKVSEPSEQELLLEFSKGLVVRFEFSSADPPAPINVSVDTRGSDGNQRVHGLANYELNRDASGKCTGWLARHEFANGKREYTCSITSIDNWDSASGIRFQTLPVEENARVILDGFPLEKFFYKNGRFEEKAVRDF